MMSFLNRFLSTKPDSLEGVPDEADVRHEARQEAPRDETDAPERPMAQVPIPESRTAPHDDPAFREAMQNAYSPPFVDGGYADSGMLEEFEADAGHPLAEGEDVATGPDVIEAMRTVYDPEIPVNIYDLGLIYEFNIADNGDVHVRMSLTAPGCPVAGEMPGMVARAVSGIKGIGKVNVRIVWEPMWTPERMSEDARLALGMI